MRHRNLTADRIRSLVQANDGADERFPTLAKVFKLIEVCTLGCFATRPYLGGTELDIIFNMCDRVIREDIRPLQHHKKRKLVTTACQTRYLMIVQLPPVEGYDTLYQLVSFEISGSRKGIDVFLKGHPVAFQYHAAERLMERTSGAFDALEVLGRSLSKWLPLTSMAGTDLRDRDDCCVPVGDGLGLLLGEFDHRPGASTNCYRFDKNGRKKSSARSEGRIFVAKTFVSSGQLRPDQTSTMRALAELDARRHQQLEEMEHDLLWNRSPHSELQPQALDLLEELRSILDPDATAPQPSPPSRPLLPPSRSEVSTSLWSTAVRLCRSSRNYRPGATCQSSFAE